MRPPPSVTIRQLIADTEETLALRLLAGEAGLAREIVVPRIQKPGLALTGYTEQLHDKRLLVLGGTELEYLDTLDPDQMNRAVTTVMASQPACIAITRGLVPPPALVQACDAGAVSLLVSHLASAEFITAVTSYLEDRMAASTSVHGVMLDVLGVGILILGKSGIGKSEIALDLITRGHRLVADDVVEIYRPSRNFVFGTGNPIIRHHLEIRGLGILNVKDLFGITSVRDTKKIELVIELAAWDAGEAYDRLGVDDAYYEVLDVALPRIRLPVSPGRAMATIIEVAARNQLLKLRGHHAARQFQESLDRRIADARRHRYDIDMVE